jgi:NADH dehydrogenase
MIGEGEHDVQTTGTGRPRIVIVGGGFGGISVARGLRRAPADIFVLDRTNHHLFQPLLYQVATAALAPSDITYPIRATLRGQKNATVLLAEVDRLDLAGKTVHTIDGLQISYDYLILACGSRHSYFGKDAWEAHAPGLKAVADAIAIRSRFLTAFEEAEKSDDPAVRSACLTFVIVGGGPTGCEMAGVLPEIARKALRPDFRRIDTADARVILVENSARVLNGFPDDLAERAMRDLKRLGVEILTGHKVVGIDADGVDLDTGERIPARTVIWAAGNVAAPIGADLGVPRDRGGKVLVEKDLSVPGHPEVFVIGDMAHIEQDGKTLVPVAQVAIQGGEHTAANLLKRLAGQETVRFHYRDKGNLAVLGRNAAVAQLGKMHLAGFPAWLIWLFVHLLYLVGYRNRISVLFQWAYAYVTSQRGARLITRPPAP